MCRRLVSVSVVRALFSLSFEWGAIRMGERERGRRTESGIGEWNALFGRPIGDIWLESGDQGFCAGRDITC